MRYILILTLAMIWVTINSFAQDIEAFTKDGKKVILNEDGTWKYDELVQTEQTVSLDCSDLILTKTDKMTGKSSTSAKETLVISDDGGKNGFGIFLLKGSNYIILIIKVAGGGSCIKDDNKINILFKDKTRLELINDGEFNCTANFTLYFGSIFGKKKQLEMFRTKEIETIRVWTVNSYVEKDFSVEQSKQLMKIFDCLINT